MKNNLKMCVTALLVVLLAVVIQGCSPAPKAPEATAPAATAPTETTAPTSTAVEKTFTMDEIAKFDGLNGNAAYVVVDGVVYDVSNVSAWNGGMHQGKVKAGQDVTDFLAQSPHGSKNLEKLPIVGKIKK